MLILLSIQEKCVELFDALGDKHGVENYHPLAGCMHTNIYGREEKFALINKMIMMQYSVLQCSAMPVSWTVVVSLLAVYCIEGIEFHLKWWSEQQWFDG